jgi:hypothetical protein
VWLPGIVVPLVIFSHLITIRALMKAAKHKNVSSPSLITKQVAWQKFTVYENRKRNAVSRGE